MNFLTWIIIIFLFISTAGAAFAASLIISSSGNGAFTLQGAGLSDVAGIDATISYDTSTLSSPRVVQGGLIAGAMMAANPNTPGLIRIAAVKASPVNGSGTIATINFATAAGSSGKILSLNAKLINGSGVPLDVQTQIVNPTTGTGSSDTTTTTQTPTDTATSNSTAGFGQRYLGPTGVTLPSESGDFANRKTSPESYPDQPSPYSGEVRSVETTAGTAPEKQKPPVSSPASSAEGKTIIYKSVLDCFREYTGKRTLKAFKALFDKASVSGVRQEPAVALSDGKTRIKVSIRIPSTGKEAPNFAVKKAKLISLKPDGNTWVIEALPDKKAYDSYIIVLDNGSVTRIPLTIAPPMDIDIGKIDTAGDSEITSTKERGTAENPLFGKKSDMLTDYVDDYIFTANYIVQKNSTAELKKDVRYQMKTSASQGH